MKTCRGLTLIELIVFILIVSVALAGVLSALNLTATKSTDPLVGKQGLAVAEGLLDEILAKDFANPAGGYTGANRALFDDVSDYNGYARTGITAIDGTLIAGLENYSVAVAVDAATTLGPPGAVIGNPNVKRVTVTVSGGGNTVSLSGYRSNYE